MRAASLALGWLLLTVAAAPVLAQPLNGRVEARSFMGPITGRTVSYHIYLPAGYDSSADRYPVIYHLHGLGGVSGGPQIASVPASFEAALAADAIGPVIIVFPSAYTDSFWADSIGGDKPAETDVVGQLIPHVDQTFRTIGTPGARVIQGFSMGGFGTFKFYAKFHDLFTACVAYDGAYVTWSGMLQFHPQIAAQIFGNSEAYYNQYSPWHWTTANAGAIAADGPVRMVVGSLLGGNRNFRDHLTGLGIAVNYVETGCGHEIGCLLTAQGLASATFIASRLDLTAPCDPDVNCDGSTDQDDVGCLIAAVAGNPGCECRDADFNADGNVDQDDVAALINTVAGGACP